MSGQRLLGEMFARLGWIREQLTGVSDLAADLDDDELSQQVSDLMRANTAALARTTELLNQERNTTGGARTDLDSQRAGAAR